MQILRTFFIVLYLLAFVSGVIVRYTAWTTVEEWQHSARIFFLCFGIAAFALLGAILAEPKKVST